MKLTKLILRIVIEQKQVNPNKIIIGHLNINSIRYKCEFLKDLTGNNIDVFLIPETKLYDTFLINGYNDPSQHDRDGNGGDLLLYFRDHIPYKKITIDFRPVLESIVIEIDLNKRKWLLIGCYNLHKGMIRCHMNSVGNKLNCVKLHKGVIRCHALKVFCGTCCLTNLVEEPTCFENTGNPYCIDPTCISSW